MSVVFSIVAHTTDASSVAADVLHCLRDAVGETIAKRASEGLSRVFPEGTPGRRGEIGRASCRERVYGLV